MQASPQHVRSKLHAPRIARDSTSLRTGSRSKPGTSVNLVRISESLIRRCGRCFFVSYGAIGDVSGLANSFEILDPNGSVFWPHGKEFYDLG